MALTARGVIARTPGAAAAVEEFLIDDPGPNEVLVRVLASGVCHTDLGVKMGTYGTSGFPFLLGHEGAGIIEKVGPGVEKPRVGDHVILAWRAPCGKCRFCLRGQPNYCANSLNAEKRMRGKDGQTLNPVLGIGTFCTHTVVHAAQAVVIDKDLPDAQMSLIGCGVMTGVGAALYSAGVRPGTSAAVFGCGGVGDSVIQGARLAGATTIIAVDIDPKKLEWAKQFGATHTVNARESDPVARIKELTGGNGVDYSFEAVGRPETLEQALFCRDLAGTCVFIGVPGPGPPPFPAVAMGRRRHAGGEGRAGRRDGRAVAIGPGPRRARAGAHRGASRRFPSANRDRAGGGARMPHRRRLGPLSRRASPTSRVGHGPARPRRRGREPHARRHEPGTRVLLGGGPDLLPR